MTSDSIPTDPRLLIVSGLSGAGKSTALEVLEDLGWETIDNVPIRLLEGLLATGPADGVPLAIGIDSRTRGYDPAAILTVIDQSGSDIEILFLDAAPDVIQRRYNETRRPHPLGRDRQIADAIRAEREMVEPLQRRATMTLDTSDYGVNELQQVMRNQFGDAAGEAMAITVTSFGFARGMPPLADLVFDMRFLDNPHWDPVLRPQTGLDGAVGEHIAQDPAFSPSFERITATILELLPHYAAQGRAYLTIAFGCTGGRHRSVYSAERMGEVLREAGHDPIVHHRNLTLAAPDASNRTATIQPGRGG